MSTVKLEEKFTLEIRDNELYIDSLPVMSLVTGERLGSYLERVYPSLNNWSNPLDFLLEVLEKEYSSLITARSTEEAIEEAIWGEEEELVTLSFKYRSLDLTIDTQLWLKKRGLHLEIGYSVLYLLWREYIYPHNSPVHDYKEKRVRSWGGGYTRELLEEEYFLEFLASQLGEEYREEYHISSDSNRSDYDSSLSCLNRELEYHYAYNNSEGYYFIGGYIFSENAGEEHSLASSSVSINCDNKECKSSWYSSGGYHWEKENTELCIDKLPVLLLSSREGDYTVSTQGVIKRLAKIREYQEKIENTPLIMGEGAKLEKYAMARDMAIDTLSSLVDITEQGEEEYFSQWSKRYEKRRVTYYLTPLEVLESLEEGAIIYNEDTEEAICPSCKEGVLSAYVY